MQWEMNENHIKFNEKKKRKAKKKLQGDNLLCAWNNSIFDVRPAITLGFITVATLMKIVGKSQVRDARITYVCTVYALR